MFVLSAEMSAQIDEQARSLQERIDQSNLYLQEPYNFSVARLVYPDVASRLGVLEDLGTLTTPESRNLVRKVGLEDGTLGVLKIIGSTAEAGEGAVLRAWHDHGLPCIEPIQYGYTRSRVDNHVETAQFLLSRFVEAPTLNKVVPADTLEQKKEVVGRLVVFLREFHRSGADVAFARTWEDRIGFHISQTLPWIQHYGLPQPPGWYEKLRWLSERGRGLLHGDVALINVLATKQGWLLLDPPGAIRGMHEADIAQICSQMGGIEHVSYMIDAACGSDPTLQGDAIACLAGINIFTGAGYCLTNPLRSDDGPIDEGDKRSQEKALDMARTYLAVATNLMGELRHGFSKPIS